MPFNLSLQSYVNRDTLEEIDKLGMDPAEIIQILHAISLPQQHYNLRVNLTKIAREDLVENLRGRGVDVKIYPELPEMVGVHIFEGLPLPRAKRVVYANKFASESVSCGANLFYPGVGPHSHVPLNANVEIREWERKIHVATGITRMNLKNPPSHKGVAVETTHSPFRMWSFRDSEEYKAGLFDDQSLPPVAAVHSLMLHYQPGAIIFDLCAAPGGKTAALAQVAKVTSGNWPEILAIDRSKNRLERLKEKVTRLGLEGITPVALKLEKIHSQNPEWKARADLVFLDPPCSALGTRPKLYIETTSDRYKDYPENQFRLVQHAWELLKPGGYLIYNTCTITLAENEGNVARILDTFDAELVSSGVALGREGAPHPALSIDETRKLRRFWPHLDDSIGYFIAKFRRKS